MWPLRWHGGVTMPSFLLQTSSSGRNDGEEPIASLQPPQLVFTHGANPGRGHHQALQHRGICGGPQNSPWSEMNALNEWSEWKLWSPAVAKWAQHVAVPPVRWRQCRASYLPPHHDSSHLWLNPNRLFERQQRITSVFQRYKRHTREVLGIFRANLKLFLVALPLPEPEVVMVLLRQQWWPYLSDSSRPRKSLAWEKEGGNCLQHQVLLVYWMQFSLLGCCANCSPTLPMRPVEEVSGKGYQLPCVTSSLLGILRTIFLSLASFSARLCSFCLVEGNSLLCPVQLCNLGDRQRNFREERRGWLSRANGEKMREEEERQQGDITVKKCDEKQPVEEQILAGGSFTAGQKRDITCR